MCNNVDECQAGLDNCHDNAFCSDTVGSFQCNCIPGYQGTGLGSPLLLSDLDFFLGNGTRGTICFALKNPLSSLLRLRCGEYLRCHNSCHVYFFSHLNRKI